MEEIVRQIQDFHAKEISGFVIHPRMGLPRSMPYLSDAYFDLVEAAVAEAARLGMSVILYDEAMYPSGAAGGLVAGRNPGYASRGLKLVEYPCGQDGGRIQLETGDGDRIVSVQAARKITETAIDPDSVALLDFDQGIAEFVPPDDGNWSVLLFAETDSKGTIRGIHRGQDDGEPGAPRAADLLNPDAVDTFISLTHDRYYKRLKDYFGTTVIAMFTDEPDLLGRRHLRGLKPWTRGFLDEFVSGGNRERDLPALWFEAGEGTRACRDRYESAIRSRLSRTYYKRLADWCESHGIGLTGHPAASDDIGLLEHFHIPGQDVVWRFIAPDNGSSLTGPHSTLGKCSSDAARHRGRRRNLNECFGVCGKESGWALTADNMKWYLDWLFVRGVNLISPHAFYYSIREERRDERPPDVGPHNIWWPHFHEFSRYIKRMSWLMTDSANAAQVAVLAQAAYLPWHIAKPLYENQIEFNYLEEDLLVDACESKAGTVRIAGQAYKAILVEDGSRFGPACRQALEAFIREGGLVIELPSGREGIDGIGARRVDAAEEIPRLLDQVIGRDVVLQPAAPSIRVSRVTKDGASFLVVANEGESRFEGTLRTTWLGRAEIWHPWSGAWEPAYSEEATDGHRIPVIVERRECVIIAIDPSERGVSRPYIPAAPPVTIDLSERWQTAEGAPGTDPQPLTSWTEWAGGERYSGTVRYETSFELEAFDNGREYELNLGQVHEMARLWVNGREAGVRMWQPYSYRIGALLRQGRNVLTVAVTNSLANRYDGLSLPSGLLGPVTLTATKPSNE
ncbi:hypothetical protein IDH41_08330 [Paenibacillus sp. IB182493]|uniref:Glycosyl hydrolases family 2 sugar binding domain-containing protein n=2 Tax=Paenibacillus arenilitoris TaxID=2772299 RepID=A0A927CKS9_9BACL|nr:hypothetical protein [Paenibacillus arenilitoris]